MPRKNTDYAECLKLDDSAIVTIVVHPEDRAVLTSFLAAFNLHFECEQRDSGEEPLVFVAGTAVEQAHAALVEFDRHSRDQHADDQPRIANSLSEADGENPKPRPRMPVIRHGWVKSPKAEGPSETIGDWEYFRCPNGDLYRAQCSLATESRLAQYVVARAGSTFALRLARITAGLPENGPARK